MTYQCLRSSAISVVIWFLAISSFTRSPISTLVCLDFAIQLLSSVISFSWHHIYLAFVHVQPTSTSSLWGIRPSGTRVPLSRGLHFSHDLIWSFLLPTTACAFQLCAISSPPSFVLSCLVLSCMFLSQITPVVSLHFDQAIFTMLFTSFSAPPLASNIEPRYLNVLTVFTAFSWM